jgi:hypothetical protein
MAPTPPQARRWPRSMVQYGTRHSDLDFSSRLYFSTLLPVVLAVQNPLAAL